MILLKKFYHLKNIVGDYSLVKVKFMEEDIVMSPLKKGTVNVTSKKSFLSLKVPI